MTMMKSRMNMSFRLLVGTRPDPATGVIVAYCPTLKLYSQGRTEEEAGQAIRSAAALYLTTHLKRGSFESTIHKLGFEAAEPFGAPMPSFGDEEWIQVENMAKRFEMDVVLPLVAAQETGRLHVG